MAVDYFTYFEPFPYELSMPLVVVVVALACSAVTRSHSTAIVLAFFITLSFALIADFCYGGAGKDINIILQSSPRFLEFVLVPPILFKSAFMLDPHDFKKFGWQVSVFVTLCYGAA